MEKFARTFMFAGIMIIVANYIAIITLDATVIEVVLPEEMWVANWDIATGFALWISNMLALSFCNKLASKEQVYVCGVPLSFGIAAIAVSPYGRVAAMFVLGVSFAGLFALHWLVNWHEKRRSLYD